MWVHLRLWGEVGPGRMWEARGCEECDSSKDYAHSAAAGVVVSLPAALGGRVEGAWRARGGRVEGATPTWAMLLITTRPEPPPTM